MSDIEWPTCKGDPIYPQWTHGGKRGMYEAQALRLFAHDLVERIKQLELPVREAMKEAGYGLDAFAYASMMQRRLEGMTQDRDRLQSQLTDLSDACRQKQESIDCAKERIADLETHLAQADRIAVAGVRLARGGSDYVRDAVIVEYAKYAAMIGRPTEIGAGIPPDGALSMPISGAQSTLELSSGMDTPWPLRDVLAKLIDATEHLLDDHDCDTHGHEEYRAAINAGKLLLTRRASAQSASLSAEQNLWHIVACPFCEKTADKDGGMGHVPDCEGLRDSGLNKLQQHILTSRLAAPPPSLPTDTDLTDLLRSYNGDVGEKDERVCAVATFTDYFVRNYPGPDTIIHEPLWHAPKIFRAALNAIKRASPPAASQDNATLPIPDHLRNQDNLRIERLVASQQNEALFRNCLGNLFMAVQRFAPIDADIEFAMREATKMLGAPYVRDTVLERMRAEAGKAHELICQLVGYWNQGIAVPPYDINRAIRQWLIDVADRAAMNERPAIPAPPAGDTHE